MQGDCERIDQLGGPAKVAALLGYQKGGVQRVQNWKARGIPAKVKLAYPELFLRELIPADVPPRRRATD